MLKIHSRCNLACDYCYMYEMADQSWRGRPVRMSPAVAGQTAARIAEHLHDHGLTSAQVVFHGGEPLLAGPRLIEHLVNSIRRQVGPDIRITFHAQTNGVELDTGYLTLFDRLNILVGVSLDGAAAAHDLHRRFPSGRGSHQAMMPALENLTGTFRHLFDGLLCTIDLGNDPCETYEALLAFDPPAVNFLLPHGNWSAPPPGRDTASPEAPYGEWLTSVFDRWYHAPRRETQVRLFEEIMQVLLGGVPASEVVGLAPVAIIVVETDGAIEQSDALKSAYSGAGATGLHVSRNSFDEALTLPSIMARQIGELALSPQCRSCRINRPAAPVSTPTATAWERVSPTLPSTVQICIVW
ncbi:FxsB family cyclophane-forming radical SAM/SPASM peptide maturase [Nonomuraea thailandensis]